MIRRHVLPGACCAVASIAMLGAAAHAERIDNQVAVFSALDKVTARIQKLEVPLGETVQFGALTITARVCYSRAPTEQPKTTSFVEVDETQLDGKMKRIFSGWMFAESPGLNAVEHPVFDLWLTECQKPKAVAASKPADPAAAARKPGAPGQGAAGQGAVPAEPTGDPSGDGSEPRRRARR